MPEIPYISSEEAAEIIGVSAAWVRQMCADGRIPGVFRIGREWVIPRASAREVAKQERKPTGRPPKNSPKIPPGSK